MSRRNKRRMEAVDITPLIDVLFMLIIFFVLMTSFDRGRVEVALPRGEAQRGKEENALILTVTRDGSVLLAGNPVSSADLKNKLNALRSAQTEVQIAGDANVPYGTVAELLDLLRSCGIPSASLLLEGGGH